MLLLLVLYFYFVFERGAKYCDEYSACLSARISRQESLAVASIARDDPSNLPGDDRLPRAH